MEENIRITDDLLPADYVSGDVLQHTDLNKIIQVFKTAINANYLDIISGNINIEMLVNQVKDATLSKSTETTLQNSDNMFPTSRQVKNYVDTAVSASKNLTGITGYDATKVQILKNVEGTLTWVDEV